METSTTSTSSSVIDDASVTPMGRRAASFTFAASLSKRPVDEADEKTAVLNASDPALCTTASPNCHSQTVGHPSFTVSATEWRRMNLELKLLKRRIADPCKLCKNYEDQLQLLQEKYNGVNSNLHVLQTDLATTKSQRDDLDRTVTAQQQLSDSKLDALEEQLKALSEQMNSALKNYQEYRRTTETECLRLEKERQTAQVDLNLIEEHYQALLGLRQKSASEQSNETIQLPATKEELELYALKLGDELLCTKIAREHLCDRIHKEQKELTAERSRRLHLEELLKQRTLEAGSLSTELKQAKEAVAELAARKATTERTAQQAQAIADEAKRHAAELQTTVGASNEQVALLKNKVTALYGEVASCEAVQKDFVKLSQDLQMQLERVRGEASEVRWQDPDDAPACSGCKATFPSGSSGSRKKLNCRHCGRIFCAACLQMSVAAGPRGRKAHVCEFCHTLLVKDSAPYFSRTPASPPQAPLIDSARVVGVLSQITARVSALSDTPLTPPRRPAPPVPQRPNIVHSGDDRLSADQSNATETSPVTRSNSNTIFS